MRILLLKIWPFWVMMIVIFAFFYRLFIPQPSIFVTPDFGRSDTWQLLIDNKSGILTTD